MNLGTLLSKGRKPKQIADASVAVWTDIDHALTPVMGSRGSAALYRRTVHMARTQYPWLECAFDAAAQAGDFTPLHAALRQQSATQAAAAHNAMMEIFLSLLHSLIGRELAERLLQDQAPTTTRGTAAQDSAP